MNSLENFSKSDIDFIVRDLCQSAEPIAGMTRNYYFQAVKYALAGIDKSVMCMDVNFREKMQRQMQVKARRYNLNPDVFMSDDVIVYNKYTQGWVGDAIDNFGTIMRPDCPVDFVKWYDSHAYNGGHPFEIYPYVCLYVVRRASGFYLELADFSIFNARRPTERVLKMYMALRRANVSVVLRDKDLLLQKLQKYNLLNR